MKYLLHNGLAGCFMPDNTTGPYDSIPDAAHAAESMFELTDEEEIELRASGVLYLRGDRKHEVGAECISIQEITDDEAMEWEEDNR